ncbi:hypothetical protein HDZ31DRAFT_61023 [Schizophyllum fasciatum]
MAHSVIFPRRAFLYAIGNTSAEVLTDELPPAESIDLLALGCGDPRSILYTVYADQAAESREFDLTCCDVEPAILARNVLLLTLLADADDVRDTAIWDIFYHLRIADKPLALLHRQCAKLVAVSESMQQWSDSSYGKFIRPRTLHTLLDMRYFWAKYAATATFSPSQWKRLRADTDNSVKELAEQYDVANVQTACRSAGPFWAEMMKSGLAADHLSYYWRHGVVGGSPIAGANFVNPTFCYTGLGSGFCLHYGTDPILGFHLDSLFAHAEGRSSRPSIAGIGAATTGTTII